MMDVDKIKEILSADDREVFKTMTAGERLILSTVVDYAETGKRKTKALHERQVIIEGELQEIRDDLEKLPDSFTSANASADYSKMVTQHNILWKSTVGLASLIIVGVSTVLYHFYRGDP